jgi:transposase
MQDTELYTKLLGITRPWYITKVVFDETPERIEIYLSRESEILLPCPECSQYSPIYDHMEGRIYFHCGGLELYPA